MECVAVAVSVAVEIVNDGGASVGLDYWDGDRGWYWNGYWLWYGHWVGLGNRNSDLLNDGVRHSMGHGNGYGTVDRDSDVLLNGDWVGFGDRHGVGTVYGHGNCHLNGNRVRSIHRNRVRCWHRYTDMLGDSRVNISPNYGCSNRSSHKWPCGIASGDRASKMSRVSMA